MVTRAQVVAEARRWIGTPFAHQGRRMGVGVDCSGLCDSVGVSLGVFAALGATDYPSRPVGGRLRAEVAARMVEIEWRAVSAGDVLLFFIGRGRRRRELPWHLVIVSDFDRRRMIHADGLRYDPRTRRGCVVETSIGPSWIERIDSCWRYPGLED